METSPVTRQFLHYGQQLAHDFSTLRLRVADRLGILPNHLSILTLVAQSPQGSVSVGALAHMLNMNQGNFSTTVKKMEQLGLIRRDRSSQDERIVHISIAEAGQDILSRQNALMRELETRFTQYPQAEVTQILASMQSMDHIFCSCIDWLDSNQT